MEYANKKERKDNLYEILFESIQEGLILVNEKGVIVDNNDTAEFLFGYEKDELLGQSIQVLVPFEQRKGHAQHVQSYNKKPEKRTMGSTLKLNGEHKDGSVFPVEVSLTPLKKEGREKFTIALISDVTMRREVEEELERMTESLERKVRERTIELKKSEQLYRSIARNFPGGVISIFDKSLKYIFAEGQGLYELGLETEDLLGLDYLERLIPEAREKVKSELEHVFDGEYRNFEVEVMGRTYLLNAVPLANSIGEVDSILVVEKNVTERKNVEKSLQLNLEKEKELNDMKSRFVSMASHEFRTPLTTVNSSAGLIVKYLELNNTDKIRKHIDRIKKSVRNLTAILNDFLSIEKLESGKISSASKICDIISIINEATEEVRDIAKDNQQFFYEGPEFIEMLSDPQLFKNVMLNLLTNAIKYSDEGGGIYVKVLDHKNKVIVSVRDEGIGIPEKDQKKMFDRFFRAGNVFNIEGTGLGLNIVKRYLDLLGGKISFSSREGVGTTFFVTLIKKK